MPIHFADNIELGAAVLGGVILGISSTSFLVASGKLTGISGFVENSISPLVPLDDKLWAWSYMLGLIIAGLLASFVDKSRLGVTAHVGYNVIVGGFIVGFGTRMGCGCTSGHGISGLPRFSLRAIVAVCCFMAMAVVAALCGRLLSDQGVFPEIDSTMELPYWSPIYVVIFLPLIAVVAIMLGLRLYSSYVHEISLPPSVSSYGSILWIKETKLQHALISFVAALVFGIGLAISGMCNPKRVLNFLDFSGPDGWDPSLIGVMGGGVVFNTISFHLLHRYGVPVLIPTDPDDTITLDNVIKMWKHPANMRLPPTFIIGSLLFGLGWGLCGICPGPGLVNLGASSRVSAVFLPSLLVGIAAHEVYKTLPSIKSLFPGDGSGGSGGGTVDSSRGVEDWNDAAAVADAAAVRNMEESLLLQKGEDGSPRTPHSFVVEDA